MKRTRRARMPAAGFAALCAAIAATACGDGAVGILASLPLRTAVAVSPATATLHVGDTLRVTGQCASCDPATSPALRWTTGDTIVAAVDSVTGLVRARRNGSTTVIASVITNRSIQGAMSVNVTP